MARSKKRIAAKPKGAKSAPSVKGETFQQKLNRLKKAGYTELFKPEAAQRKTKRGLRERARTAAIRMIAKRDGITIKEAKKLHKRALVEVVWAQPTRAAYRKFLEVSPGQYLEIEKGKPVKSEFTFGTVRRAPYIQRIQSLHNYWATIHLLAETWDISTEEARKYYSKVVRQFGKKEGLEFVYTDLGVYEERYKRSSHDLSDIQPKRKRTRKPKPKPTRKKRRKRKKKYVRARKTKRSH